ncbi:hypothetical protein PCANC_04302 [Puccinia coronata f. sp. avenae]|uniref:Uncharacterized protein n=1 Tax=Puccinia coronata f. sp. avenae TaxID=200324 RepID=A0A2N5VUN8_9BASI|nr:hypothetical protein PCANC_04302 [Puccinia coronata f. sp. avenae]
MPKAINAGLITCNGVLIQKTDTRRSGNSTSLADMKVIFNLLIVGAQLAINSKGMDWANWSGEENRFLHERLYSAYQSMNPPVYHITMSEKESQEHRLIFDKDAFPTPSNEVEDQPLKSKLKLINSKIEEHSTRSHSYPPTLMFSINELREFILKFQSAGSSSRKSSRVVSEAMNDLVLPESAATWKTVYEKRLGIDFEKAREWFLKLWEKRSPNKRHLDHLAPEKLVRFLLCYIFFVDMILTTIPKVEPTEVVADRIQSFRAAVSCFEELVQQTLERTVRPKHLPAGWTGLSNQFLGPVAQDQPGPVGQICPTSWLLLWSDSARLTTG